MEVIASGKGEFRPPDPDGLRAYVLEHKDRRLVSKVMTEKEAVERFVHDGDYVSYDLNSAQRGPSSLYREMIRQRKKDLWIAAKFTGFDVTLLVAGGWPWKANPNTRSIVTRLETGLILGRMENQFTLPRKKSLCLLPRSL